MAERKEHTAAAAAPRLGRPGGHGPGRRGHGPMMGPPGLIGTGAKSKDFKRSAKRLAGLLKPHAVKIAVVILLAIVSVALAVIGPKLLGRATNVLFEGV